MKLPSISVTFARWRLLRKWGDHRPADPRFLSQTADVTGHRGPQRGTSNGSARPSCPRRKALDGPGGTILNVARRKRVSFQGEKGAFSQVAVQQLLGTEVEVVPCQRFEDVFRSLADGKVDAAVIPIENTLHGSRARELRSSCQFRIPDPCRDECARFAQPDRLSRRSVPENSKRVFAPGCFEPVH